ncbi:hypothetical protein FSP39_000562 [Pinctada imbricata]|uniref:Uncharacterized protein n=1 Tax=Pinctada imbricata TaxID=66713 RepID=A0AA88Y870_PINIB|nr:hypothetical protein FSP39_000562 [Pinctada imbricata]
MFEKIGDIHELEKILTILISTALTIEHQIEHRRTPSKLEEDEGGYRCRIYNNSSRFQCPLSGFDIGYDITGRPRLQQNQRSSFIDGTMIYGFDDEFEDKLREPGTGYLKTGGDNQLKLEPVEDEMEPPCTPVKNLCFTAGDHRSLETVPLTVIHIIFMRRHNLIVDKLREIPLPWTPELLYQEAKRIVVAELQHITYNEFLPRVLGTSSYGQVSTLAS